jgi:hypothetical protein
MWESWSWDHIFIKEADMCDPDHGNLVTLENFWIFVHADCNQERPYYSPTITWEYLGQEKIGPVFLKSKVTVWETLVTVASCVTHIWEYLSCKKVIDWLL